MHSPFTKRICLRQKRRSERRNTFACLPRGSDTRSKIRPPSSPGVPSVSSLVKHFGSLRKAYALVGHVSKRDCDWIDTRDTWAAVVRKHAAEVADALNSNANQPHKIDAVEHTVIMNGKVRITFLVARQAKKRQPGHATHWRVYRRQKLSGLLALLRLDNANRDIADYVLISASEMTKCYLRLRKAGLGRNVAPIGTLPELIERIKSRLGRGV